MTNFLDKLKFAASGTVLAFKKPTFLVAFALSFIVFGTLMNLLSGGSAAFNLLAVADFPGKLQIIWDAFLSLFGVGRNFLDWALNFFLALLTATLIGLISLVYKSRKSSAASAAKSPDTSEDKSSANLQNTGLVAGLAILGSGCPTCGTTLLAPLIAAAFGSGSLALASAVSGIFTALAVLLGLYSLYKLGYESYVIIVGDSYRKKKEEHAR